MPRVDFSSLRPKPWLDGNQVDALFKQDKVWIDANLTTHTIKEIPTDYLANIVPYVARNYWRFRLGAQMQAIGDALEEPWFGITEWVPGLPTPLPHNVEVTPLFQALTGELETRGET